MRHIVLVTDGEQRAALAVVRSLGRAGHAPFVCSVSGRSLAGASRHAREEAKVPDALREPEAFVEALDSLRNRWKIDTLLPIAEPALLSVLAAASRFDGVRIPFPDLVQFLHISDKALLLDTASQLRIAVPQQTVINAPAAAGEVAAGTLRFPVVLKPARSVSEGPGGWIKLAVSHAANSEELKQRLKTYPPSGYPILLQQRILGSGVGVFLLRWEGETFALFSHRRIREKPPSGGVSVYRESIPPDPDLVTNSELLLQRFGWQGVAMVEYKIERTTGTPYLMEINGRFWGSLQLAIDAGVDFPALLLALSAGERPAPVTAYWTGIRSRWWWGDVDQLLTRLRRSPAALALEPDSPGRLHALTDFLKLWRPGDRNEVFRWSDPAPFFRETIEWLKGK